MEASTCGLSFLGSSLHLMAYLSTGEMALAPFYLDHYERSVGVQRANMRIFLSVDAYRDGRSAHTLQQIFDGANVSIDPQAYSTSKMLAHFNAHIAELPSDAWVIQADMDEHFTYPCDMPTRLAEHDIWRALLVDALAPSGHIEPVRSISDGMLEQQFPLACYVRTYLRTSIQSSKVALMRVREREGNHARRAYANAHQVIGEWAKMRARPLPPILNAGACAHFTLTQNKLDVLLAQQNQKDSPYFNENPTKSRDYSKMLNFMSRHTNSSSQAARDARTAPECRRVFASNINVQLFFDRRWEELFPCNCSRRTNVTTNQTLKMCGCHH